MAADEPKLAGPVLAQTPREPGASAITGVPLRHPLAGQPGQPALSGPVLAPTPRTSPSPPDPAPAPNGSAAETAPADAPSGAAARTSGETTRTSGEKARALLIPQPETLPRRSASAPDTAGGEPPRDDPASEAAPARDTAASGEVSGGDALTGEVPFDTSAASGDTSAAPGDDGTASGDATTSGDAVKKR